jgi:DNA-binding MarR family transcriptional regulator
MDERVIKGVRCLVSTYREFEQAALRAKLSLPQYRMLLFLLNFGPRKASDIASVYLLKKPTVAELLGTLETRGLVRRSPDEVDQRSAMVSISASGRKALKDFERLLATALESLIEGNDRERILEGFEFFHEAFVRVRSERMATLKGYRKPQAIA